MYWYLTVLKKYAVFSGRARRKEYWTFALFNSIIGFVLGFIEGILGINSGSDGGILTNIFYLAILIPSIAVGVRRIHDVGKSGWFLLIPIYNCFVIVKEGDKSDNQYGTDPKAETQNIKTP